MTKRIMAVRIEVLKRESKWDRCREENSRISNFGNCMKRKSGQPNGQERAGAAGTVMAGKAGAAAVMSGRKRAGAQPGMETAAGAMGTGVQADTEMTESKAVKEDPPMKAGGRRAEPAAAI